MLFAVTAGLFTVFELRPRGNCVASRWPHAELSTFLRTLHWQKFYPFDQTSIVTAGLRAIDRHRHGPDLQYSVAGRLHQSRGIGDASTFPLLDVCFFEYDGHAVVDYGNESIRLADHHRARAHAFAGLRIIPRILDRRDSERLAVS